MSAPAVRTTSAGRSRARWPTGCASASAWKTAPDAGAHPPARLWPSGGERDALGTERAVRRAELGQLAEEHVRRIALHHAGGGVRIGAEPGADRLHGDVFAGEGSTGHRSAVLLNAAGAIAAAGHASDLREGLELARKAIDSGAAAERPGFSGNGINALAGPSSSPARRALSSQCSGT